MAMKELEQPQRAHQILDDENRFTDEQQPSDDFYNRSKSQSSPSEIRTNSLDVAKYKRGRELWNRLVGITQSY